MDSSVHGMLSGKQPLRPCVLGQPEMSHSALADMLGPAFRGGRCRVQIGRTSWSWPRRRSWGGWAVFLLGMGQGTAVCPICCNVVPIPIINDHIDSGCTMMTKPAPSWGSLASSPSSANATPNRKRRRRSHFVECPVCQKSVAEINLDDHLDKSCLAKSSYPPPATVPMSQSNRVDPSNTPGRSINDVLSPKPGAYPDSHTIPLFSCLKQRPRSIVPGENRLLPSTCGAGRIPVVFGVSTAMPGWQWQCRRMHFAVKWSATGMPRSA